MKLYILKNREQIVTDMEQDAIMQYCEEHGFSMFFFETSYMTNDWNWRVQYPDLLYICAKTLDDAKDFISLGASRLGTSRIIKILKESNDDTTY